MGTLLFLPLALLAFLFMREGLGLRDSILRALLMWGAGILVITELLSPFHLITRVNLSLAWLAVSAAIAALLFRRPRADSRMAMAGSQILIPIAIILLVTAIIAFAAQPNNWDSMTYHMARVANWAQRASVQHYPTHILRQLSSNPWAEFAILNFQVLQDSDRWASFVQWLALGGSAIAVSLILRELGFRFEVQGLGALLAITAPMIVLQSTSTQNDLVCALWVASFVYFTLTPRANWVFAALSLALAFNTKATAYIFSAPFLIVALLKDWKHSGAKTAVLRAAILGAVVFGLNAGHYSRNYRAFGRLLGDAESVDGLQMEAHDPAHIFSTALRNASLHWGTPVGRITMKTDTAIMRLHSVLGIDVNDPRTSTDIYHIPVTSNHEDNAGNFLHFWWTFAAFLILFRKRRQFPLVWSFALQLALSFLLFSALIKWQPWSSRLQVPLFVLSAVVGAAAASVVFRTDRSLRGFAYVFFVGALPWLFFNRSRPLIELPVKQSEFQSPVGTWRAVVRQWIPSISVLTASREHQIFANMPELEPEFRRAVARAHNGGCRNIGLILGSDSWEYPIHVLALRDPPAPQFKHIMVNNPSASLPDDPSPVCHILVIN